MPSFLRRLRRTFGRSPTTSDDTTPTPPAATSRGALAHPVLAALPPGRGQHGARRRVELNEVVAAAGHGGAGAEDRARAAGPRLDDLPDVAWRQIGNHLNNDPVAMTSLLLTSRRTHLAIRQDAFLAQLDALVARDATSATSWTHADPYRRAFAEFDRRHGMSPTVASNGGAGGEWQPGRWSDLMALVVHASRNRALWQQARLEVRQAVVARLGDERTLSPRDAAARRLVIERLEELFVARSLKPLADLADLHRSIGIQDDAAPERVLLHAVRHAFERRRGAFIVAELAGMLSTPGLVLSERGAQNVVGRLVLTLGDRVRDHHDTSWLRAVATLRAYVDHHGIRLDAHPEARLAALVQQHDADT